MLIVDVGWKLWPQQSIVCHWTHETPPHVSPRLIQKHYTNAPRVAMVVQQSKIKCRKQVNRFRAHSWTQSVAMIKISLKNSEKTQKRTRKMPFFHDWTKRTQRMSMKPIWFCFTFNFWSLDTHDTPGGGGIISCTCTGQIRLQSPIVKLQQTHLIPTVWPTKVLIFSKLNKALLGPLFGLFHFI